jgi:hypothetical protein
VDFYATWANFVQTTIRNAPVDCCCVGDRPGQRAVYRFYERVTTIRQGDNARWVTTIEGSGTDPVTMTQTNAFYPPNGPPQISSQQYQVTSNSSCRPIGFTGPGSVVMINGFRRSNCQYAEYSNSGSYNSQGFYYDISVGRSSVEVDRGPCIDGQPAECLTGACCLPVGGCVQLDVHTCAARGGTYHGDRTRCETEVCDAGRPTGACCLPDGSCQTVSERRCGTLGGTYYGDDTPCAAVNCPPPPSGACCRPNGSCFISTQSECKAVAGTWAQGRNCAEVQCVPPPLQGACCLQDGSCILATSTGCFDANGTYRGDGTDCATANCPPPNETHPCCHAGAHGFCLCTMETQQECSQIVGCNGPESRGVWFPTATSCDSVDCASPFTGGSRSFL